MTAAAAHGVSLLVFPELSLTGYEPELAAELAVSIPDSRLEPLVALARRHHIRAVVGAPLEHGGAKPALGALVISNTGINVAYHKMHLGSNETAHFERGDRPVALEVLGHKVGLAICADSKEPGHADGYARLGAGIYAASVFMNADWYETDMPALVACAERTGMLTVMANHADSIGSYASVGKSSIWSPGGAVLVQTTGTETALLMASNRHGDWSGEIALL